MTQSVTGPAIALVVCTRNRGAQLPVTLASHAAMRPSVPWELVLVDNGSTDSTPALLRDFAARASFSVTLVHEPRPGLASARNAGVRAARAPLLAFTDDDCYPDHDLLDRWVECFADPAIGYAAGRILLHDPEDFPITIRTDLEPQTLRPGAFVEPGFLQGANMAFRRELLRELGGFDPALGPGGRFNFEDLDMSSRASSAGAAGGYFPGPTVRHHHRRRHPAQIADLRHSYARGRGAYFASLLLRGDGSRSLFGHLRRSLAWKSRTEVVLEVVSAVHYAAYRLARRAERPLRG
ncbi:MAG: glycosyltransferase family A protein [Gemmatimonadota bacterium]